MSTGSTITLPHLQSLTLTPTRASRASAPLSVLEKIDRVEINRVTVRGGVVYYVLDVYLEHSTSRIPTNKTAKVSSSGRPDYQLERRFNDFANLRYQVWAYAQRKHQDGCACKYCDAFMGYIVHSMSQPRLFVKIATGVDARKKLMATFCNEFLSMAVGGKTEPRPRNIACDGFQAIPYVMERFFRKEEA
ncbi:hypothetical protein PF005_g17790 [Phytophthora fragariae]|nr:hypothetical protein PF003_g8583 [Phytophthora fragariae]KAE8931020.1 hypothetical protein PF009_g18907 [Phytophthora fragariae]KAE8999415.1 hypothetical protein PF011_g14634 [Phytophthora fragariae]KAE9094888.1 hypothetical protein PF007_g17595 [Phytophthora fragariae]KAE9096879.1 hypothetical protein PF010_g16166 [Phytophthora fragariae]